MDNAPMLVATPERGVPCPSIAYMTYHQPRVMLCALGCARCRQLPNANLQCMCQLRDHQGGGITLGVQDPVTERGFACGRCPRTSSSGVQPRPNSCATVC